MKRMPGIAVLAAVTIFAAGCGGGPDNRLNAGGSTFVYPMMSKWAAEYNKVKKVEVNYQSIGSGGGIAQMTAKTFDFGCTDGPMNNEQLQKCLKEGAAAVHIPLCMGAVAPTYNLEGVTESFKFTGPLLADIYLGRVTKWNDPALKKLNPNAALPDKEIVVVHRSDGSGTTYIWVDYLAQVSPEWKKKVGVATSVNWPAGVGMPGNEGVAGQVSRSAGSIGYVELTYVLQKKLQYGLVQNKEGAFIKADLASVRAAADASLKDIPDDLRYSITDAPGKDSYPISGTVWAVLYDKLPAGRGQLVVDFLRWVTHEGQQFCEPLSYARLPAGLVERLTKKLDNIKVGS
jgi:phosphate transport system substrate-binding protein